MSKPKIYISGPITGNPAWREQFAVAKQKMERLGYQVLTPAIWDETGLKLEYEDYMTLDLAMVSICDAIYMIPGWSKSAGANREIELAQKLELVIRYGN